MKKTALILIALLAANATLADEPATNTNLTLAAADVSAKTVWVETEEEAQTRIDEDLTAKADVLNAKLNAQLEKQLEDKVTQELGL